ncbi:MAG TPA: ribose 5-phosphate isomerase B [Candidatus Acidoferrales bacterium]|nr:ribose 5-phosphate isomerase B [Candidatus Acidoferrales bacterium]
MKLVIGSDHAGFQLKETTRDLLQAKGYDVLDVGAFNENPSDYPDFAEAVAKAVIEGRAERGIVICGSGVGAGVAANKVPGIRAGQCHDTYSAHQGVEHDDMNVLVLGARVIGSALAQELVTAFLGATYKGHEPGQERLQRRVDKIASIERRYSLRVKGSA